ncbi:MAG TPA: hypothetical protein PL189_08620 [bacterium]|nr:hypothetical protein [bacterium]HOY44787.1 hypothetical protein [bacterium]
MTRKTALMVALFAALVLAGTAGATDWREFMIAAPSAQIALQDTVFEEVEEEYTVDARNGGKALIFSAALPGAGQLYAGSYLKALGFIAVEAAGWYLYSDFSGEGNRIEDEFEAYANQNWSEDQYWNAIASLAGLSVDNREALREWEHANFSHGLHLEKDQQYYEMIGKYNQFNYGWNDVYNTTPRPTDKIIYLKEQERSAKRLYYEGRRNASNTAFKRATGSLTLVMINHLASALDAVWTVSRHNRSIAEARLLFEPRHLDQHPYSALTLRVDW